MRKFILFDVHVQRIPTNIFFIEYRRLKINRSHVFSFSCISSRVGNFIIGASGSDKQTLCESSVTRAALAISAVNKIKKKKASLSFAYNSAFIV